MPFVAVRDLQIYYEIRGSGPRLLAINGTGGDLRRPPNVFQLPFAQRFETLSYDQRGLGRTSRPDVPYSMADYADDAAALLDALGWERCLVYGFSFGGMVAQEFALRYPHRVERLVLAGTTSGGAGGESYPLHQLSHLRGEDYVKRLLELSDTRLDAQWQAANPERFRKMVERKLGDDAIGADEPNREVGTRRQLEARVAHDTYERLASLSMPVLVCGGCYDGLAPPEAVQAMQRRIPNSRLEMFDGGHVFALQDPRAAPCIEAFLSGSDAADHV